MPGEVPGAVPEWVCVTNHVEKIAGALPSGQHPRIPGRRPPALWHRFHLSFVTKGERFTAGALLVQTITATFEDGC